MELNILHDNVIHFLVWQLLGPNHHEIKTKVYKPDLTNSGALWLIAYNRVRMVV